MNFKMKFEIKYLVISLSGNKVENIWLKIIVKKNSMLDHLPCLPTNLGENKMDEKPTS
jgi:hypothetical protein